MADASSYPSARRHLARFEEGLGHYLAGNAKSATALWRDLLAWPGLDGNVALLCRGALGDIPPDRLAAEASRRLSITRAMGLWLAAERTQNAEKRATWGRQAADSARGPLPWLYYWLNKGAS